MPLPIVMELEQRVQDWRELWRQFGNGRRHHTRADDAVDRVFQTEREWKNRKRIVQTEPKRLPGHISCEQTDYVRFIPAGMNRAMRRRTGG